MQQPTERTALASDGAAASSPGQGVASGGYYDRHMHPRRVPPQRQPSFATQLRETRTKTGHWSVPLFRLLTVPLLALHRHWGSVLAALLSAFICWHVHGGHGEDRLIDPLIFKSIFVVFGFALGFRNLRANNRRAQAFDLSSRLFRSSWGILALYPPDHIKLVRPPLLFVLSALARHVRLLVRRESWRFSLVGMEPHLEEWEEEAEKAEKAAEGGFFWWMPMSILVPHWFPKTQPRPHEGDVEPRLAPHVAATTFFAFAEELLEKLELPLGAQARRRTFWVHKATFLEALGEIVELCVPAASDRFKTLVDTCLLLFAIMLPWGLTVDERILPLFGDKSSVTFHVGTGFILLLNTLLVCVVFLGLNALAEETEDPFDGTEEDVDLDENLRFFEMAVESYEEASQKAVASARPSGEKKGVDDGAFERNAGICGYGVWLESQKSRTPSERGVSPA